MSAVISPLHIQAESLIDGVIMLASGILLFAFAKTKGKMTRLEGIICVILYMGYTFYLLLR